MPSHFGVADTSRNIQILSALMGDVNAHVIDETGDALSLAMGVENSGIRGIIVLSLLGEPSKENIMLALGIVENPGFYTSEMFNPRNEPVPLVVHGLDGYLVAHEEEINTYPVNTILQLISIAGKHAHPFHQIMAHHDYGEVSRIGHMNLYTSILLGEQGPITVIR